MSEPAPSQPPAGRDRPAPDGSRGPELPTGTVTFLFTDIEGSTRLLQALGDRYPPVRDEHAAILRRAIRDQDGVEVSTEGDSFFAAFASPVAAVQAAVAAQRGLATARQPPGAAHLVRGPGAGDRRGQAAAGTGPAAHPHRRRRHRQVPPALQVAGQLAPEYRDGAFFADLSAVTDPALVPSVLARVLRVPEAPGRPSWRRCPTTFGTGGCCWWWTTSSR